MVIFYQNENDVRCPVCLLEWNKEDLLKANINTCPQCKTNILPIEIKNDGYIKINWQELRVLAIYAKRWSTIFNLNNKNEKDALTALKNIFASLEKYKPHEAEQLLPEQDTVVISTERRKNTPSQGEELEIRVDERSEDKNVTGGVLSPYFKKL